MIFTSSSNLPRMAACMAALLALSACEGQNARDVLGLGRKAPDEFRVVARPPLSVPPDFALRPPSDGPASDLNLPAADRQAHSLLTGSSDAGSYDPSRTMGPAETAVGVVKSYELQSQADENFLGQIGATQADPKIREKIYRDRMEETPVSQGGKAESDSLFGWLGSSSKKDEVLLDAEGEKKRLEQNAREGKPVTSGQSPTVEKKEEGPLQGLFK